MDEEDTLWFAGVTFGGFQTKLAYPGGMSLEERLAAVAFGRRVGAYTLHGNAGAVLSGTLQTDGRTFDIGPGWLGSLSVSRRWLPLADSPWFVTGSLTLGTSSASTRENGVPTAKITAVDLRLGGVAGVTLWDSISPYVLARGFSGPVLWELDGRPVRVGDLYHYNLGADLSLRLPLNLVALLEFSALGERSLALGVSALF